MSRHGYVDEESEPGQFAMWRGRVMSAIRGKRGQKLLRDLRDALDAMPEKRLIRSALVTAEGSCSLGCVAQYRKVDVSDIAPEDFEEDREWCNATLAERMDIAECLVAEVEYENDEGSCHMTPEKRWAYMRRWAEKHIAPTPTSNEGS